MYSKFYKYILSLYNKIKQVFVCDMTEKFCCSVNDTIHNAQKTIKPADFCHCHNVGWYTGSV